ncbi:large ribosomal subunit protein mL48-like [Antedon mediterranea]|uniref:large ribosomal subunit protein mL48-like n=1 Tax=Antedon mediterranea TaxID=105859 RepID=UPI003AF5CEDA
MNITLRRIIRPVRNACLLKQSRVQEVTYCQLLKHHRQQVFTQSKSYHDNHETDLEEFRYQPLPEQDIPEPSSANIYPVTNITLVGYDCTAVEHYAQFAHNLAIHMDINVIDTYALPGKSTLIHTIRKQGISENLKPKDFTLKEHERVIQVQDLSSTDAPLYLEVLLQHVPQGVVIDLKQHTLEDYQSRFIRKEVPESL